MGLSSKDKYSVYKYTGLQSQTSSSIVTVPIGWGANRAAPNLIWYDDFQAKPNKTKGKGGGKEVASYNYSASIILALAQGPIHGIGKTWADQSKEVTFASTGFTFFIGTDPQSPWSYVTAHHPAEAMGYNGVAYIAKANYAMGQSPTLPGFTFEIQGLRFGSQVGGDGSDADPALIVSDFLTNDIYGVEIPGSVLGNLMSTPAAPTTGDGTFQTYCQAMGFGMSPFLSTQETALTTLDRWTQLMNTAVYWSGYALKFVPYGDSSITGNGVTYNPNITAVYDLTDNDYVGQKNKPPVQTSRTDPADAYNSVRILINQRNQDYNPTPIELQDQGLVEEFGQRQDSSLNASEICVAKMAATIVQLRLLRKAYIRNTYSFTLPHNFCLLEPMDCVTLTDPNVLTQKLVRITDVEEDDNGQLKIKAEELNIGQGTAGGFTPQHVSGSGGQNQQVVPAPVNAPIIFEPPAPMTQGVPEVWIAASGGTAGVADPNWGGAQVWISTDGTNYNQIGEIEGPAIQGVLTANLAAYGGANPDTGHTLSVSTNESAGELVGGSSSDAANSMLLCYVDGEFISFENATLTGTNAYDLTTLYRGLQGTTAGAHLSGTAFARLDTAIYKYQLPPQYVGVGLFFKFPSFNIYEQQLQDLSTCTPYTFTPAGTGYTSQPPGSVFVSGVPNAPTSLTANGAIGSNNLSWTAPSGGGMVAEYKIFAIHGSSGSFGAAVLIGTTTSTVWTHGGLTTADTWRYFVVANNSAGDSTPAGPQNATTNAAAAFVTSYFGSGAPSTLHNNGDLYFNTAATPYVEYVQNSGAWVQVAGAGGGGGGGGSAGLPISGIGYASPANEQTPSVNFYIASLVSVPEDMTITKVAFQAGATTGGADYCPFVYPDGGGVPSGALLGSGPQITGVTAGYNEAPLSAAVTVHKGDLIWVGVSVTGSAISNLWHHTEGRGAFCANGGSNTPAGTAPGFTAVTSVGNIYGFWGVGAGSSGQHEYEGFGALPLAATFTPVNQSVSTLTDGSLGLILNCGARASFNNELYVKTAPATPYSLYARVEWVATVAGNSQVGVCVRNSSTGAFTTCGMGIGSSNEAVLAQGWNSPSSFNGNPAFGIANGGANVTKWFRIDNDGTNLKFYSSFDGIDWSPVWVSEPLSSLMTTADQIGIYVLPDPTGIAFARISSFSTTLPA